MDDRISYRARWARRLVRETLASELNEFHATQSHSVPRLAGVGTPPGGWNAHNLPLDSRLTHNRDGPQSGSLSEASKVCIVGAGVSGLYIAMILDDLAIENLSYDILEASDRIGGRMYTHHFTPPEENLHDYYDIGAMRFPKIGIMKRTFDLFERLQVPQIPYYYSDGSGKTPSRYNDIVLVGQTPPGDLDPFKIGAASGGSVPDATLQKGVSAILKEAYGPFKESLKEDWDTGFAKLMKQDQYSTRQYLQTQMEPGYDFYSIQWMETNDSSSGLYDQAFSESVIDSFDFDAPGEEPEQWVCVLGGTSLVGDAMQKRINVPVGLNKRVHKISIDHTSSKNANVFVKCSDELNPRDPYITVFNTTSLGCLQRMDLTALDLHPSQKDAIRCLHYDDSAKVAIKFSYPWWIEDCGITKGGVASTDLPLRTCVYPSYNLEDRGEAVLLCSYTWSQDAVRTGSLINANSPEGEDQLRELMLDDLAKLHQRSFGDKSLDDIRGIIAGAYRTHHAFSWSHDPYTSGAFALFGPSQFSKLYPYLTRPSADSKFHMVGEASSAHHAWIVGALDSAYAAVARFLIRYELWDALAKLEVRWGEVGELETGFKGTAHLQVAFGMLKKGEFVKV